MKYLHSWLQEYIEDKIPTGKDFVDTVSINAFEIEEIIEIENKLAKDDSEKKDFVYEIKILPNRNHDALSHYFMAKELATIFNLRLKEINFKNEDYKKDFSIKKVYDDYIKISDIKSCTRFMGCKVKNIKIKESPDFIKYRLEAIGQKSINNIVDITNYVQFAFNKPMHAYDENLVSEYLEARFAKEGEILLTLDERELHLDDKTLVISDKERVLGLAGIKGGKYSGISLDTKNIIVESANFNSVLIRKTSQKYDLRTDASKRFENTIADDLVEIGMIETLKLIKSFASDDNTEIEINEIVDNFPKEKLSNWIYKISISKNEINNKIGINLSKEDIENIFKRLYFDYKYISTKDNLLEKIKEVINKPYKNPSSMREDAPEAFSCSSLISYIYEGVFMPSISIDKYLYTKDLAKDIKDISELRFGDLVFINTEKGKIYYEGIAYKKGERVDSGVDHLGMYLGEGKIIHSSRYLEKGTEIEDISKFLEKGKLVGFGRVLENLDEERFIIDIPFERLDLRIKEDIAEEVARVYGLNNIVGVVPELKGTGKVLKNISFENKIRNILFKYGFSEVMNYALRNKGDIEIVKSIAQDKNKLRNNLLDGLEEAVQKNIFNMPLLDIDEIRIFEFGNVYRLNENKEEFEEKYLAIAIDDGKKNKNYNELKNHILNDLKTELNIGSEIKILERKNEKQKENAFEINFSELIKDLESEKDKLDYIPLSEDISNREIKYKVFPLTPFIVRDIATWCDVSTKSKDIEEIIKNNISPLCQSVRLFDEFEKEIDGLKKKSFAFRLIYQDEVRTLTDEEVNIEAEKIYSALKERGFEIR